MYRALLALFLTVNAFSFFNYPHNRKGIIIEMDNKSASEVALKSGDSANISGSICASKFHIISNKAKCYKLKSGNLPVRFFFPDKNTEVTEHVSINTSKSEHEFSFTTPELQKQSENKFYVVVAEDDQRIKKLEKTQAKLNKRILYLKERVSYFENKPRHEKVVLWLKKLVSTLESTSVKLDKLFEEDPSILATMEYPLQIDNEYSSVFRYSTFFSGHKLSLEIDNGSLIDDEMADVTVKTKNLSHLSFWFPDIGDSDDGNDESFKSDGHQVYKLALEFNGQKIFDSGMVTLKFGEEISKTIKTSKISAQNLNDFELSLFKNRESFIFKNKFYETLYGEISHRLSVASDNTTPIISDFSPLDTVKYAQNISKIEAIVQDSFGRVDQSSIIVEKHFNGEVVTMNHNQSLLDYERQIKIEAELGTLSEGDYEFRVYAKDSAGNVAQDSRSFKIDRTPPEIILAASGNILTNNPSYDLSFIIDDKSPVETKILLNNQEVYYSTSFIDSFILTLSEGINTIEIHSIDSAKNQTTKILSNVVLDTIAPSLVSLSPNDGEVISTLGFSIELVSNEPLSSASINGQNIQVFEDKILTSLLAPHEGVYTFSIVMTDLAGNSKTIQRSVEIYLKVLNGDLISIEPVFEQPKLKIVGGKYASRPGVEINLNAGFFNKEKVISNDDGSFEIEMDLFSQVELVATDDAIGRTDRLNLSYNIDTTLAGVVRDYKGAPLMGVTVSISSTGQSSVTDGTGTFKIPNPATGDQLLVIDGSTIPLEISGPNKKYFATKISVVIGALQFNTLEEPIYITPLIIDGSETTIVDGESATVVSPHAEGVELRIPSGSVTFPDGTKNGSISIVEIPSDRTSIAPLDYAVPDTVYSLEPSGTKFSEPIELVLPNVNEFPPGMQTVIMSKNSVKGIWEIDGVARVSEDGISIITEPGQGITHFSDVYTAPLGMQINTYNGDETRGINVEDGAVSSTIELPAYKVLGDLNSLSLSYKSNWANPNVVVSNILDVPRNEVRLTPITASGRSLFGSGSVSVKGKSWVEPEWIDVQFYSENIITDKMRFSGLPQKSVVSYAVDMSSQKSGIIPYSSRYELKLKQMVMGTKKTTTKKLFGKTKVRYESFRETRDIEKVFPSDITSFVKFINYKESSAGRGWHIGSEERIYTSSAGKLLLVQNGVSSVFSVNNQIQTLGSNIDGNVKFDKDDYYLLHNNSVSKFNYNNSLLNSAQLNRKNEFIEVSNIDKIHSDSNIRKCWTRTYKFQEDNLLTDAIINDSQLGFLFSDNGMFLNLKDNKKYGIQSIPSLVHDSDNRSSKFDVLHGGFHFISLGSLEKAYDYALSLPNSSVYSYSKEYQYYLSSNSFFQGISKCFSHKGFFGKKGFSNTGNILFNNVKDSVVLGDKFIVADSGNNRIRLIDVNTSEVSTFAGNGQTYARAEDSKLAVDVSLYHPQALTKDDFGNIYVATENGLIYRVGTDKRIYWLAGKLLSEGGVFSDSAHAKDMIFNNPSGVVYDNEKEYLYVSDTGHNRVVRIDMNTLVATVVAGNGECGIARDDVPAVSTNLCSPKKIGLDAEGNLLIHDSGHNRIRKVIFSASENGSLSYIPVVPDGSKVLRLEDGTFRKIDRDETVSSFNTQGLIVAKVSKIGRTIDYEYNDNKLSTITDPLGNKISLNYSGDLLSSIVDHTGRETTFEHSNGMLTSVVYPDGATRLFEYNQNGVLQRDFNQNQVMTQYFYNEWGRLISVKNSGVEISYDDSTSKTIGNNYTSNNVGQMKSLEKEELVDGIRNPRGNTTEFNKDESGYVNKITDADEKITQVERDFDGRPIKITRPDESYVDFEYAPVTFDLIKKFDSSTGVEIKYVYNEAGLLLRTLENNIVIEENVYNEFNQLISKTNRLGQKIQYEYNSLGLVTKKIAPDESFTSFSYDAFGNIESSTDEAGKVRTFTRDAAGNVISISNAEGQMVNREYDEFNRLTSVTSNKNEKTSYVYSPTGQLLSIVDPNLKVTSFTYDAMDRLIQKVDPVGRVISLEYDQAGNVTKEIDPSGNVKTFAYNKLDKLVKKVLPDDVYEFEYDVRGNVSMVKNKITQINFEYDHLESGDVVTVAGTFGVGSRSDLPSMDLEYEYDSHANRVALIDGAEVTNYEYDIGDRLRKITNHKNEIFTFDYDTKNRLKLITRPGSETTYNFFNNDILSQILHKSGSTTIANFDFEVNNIGNITQKRTLAGNFDYVYDGNNQLTSATNPETIIDEIYLYDSLGNRTQDQNGSYSYEQTGQKLQEDYKNLYFYDNNGNLTSIIEKGSNKTKNYIYNSENRLIEFKEFDEQASLIRQASYAYDALGRRVEKAVIDLQVPQNNTTRRYIYDGEDILKVLDESNNVISKYTHSSLRIDDSLAIDNKQDNKSYYFLKDHLGSIIDIVNEDNTFKQHYAYSSFGELQKVTDINGNDVTSNPTLEHHFAYTGREYDQESGLYHYRARAYDARTGRFLQTDPHDGVFQRPRTVTNKYIYTANNPIINKDPDGEFFFNTTFLAGVAAIWGTGEIQEIGRSWLFAEAAFVAIALSGGTASGSLSAVGSTAGGSALAAGAYAGAKGGNFLHNFSHAFHNYFRISVSFLALSALSAPGGVSVASGNGVQGQIVSNGAYSSSYHSGLTIGSSATMTTSSLATHEFGHTAQFVIASGIAGKRNKGVSSTWKYYLSAGAVGTIPKAGYIVEVLADILGAVFF